MTSSNYGIHVTGQASKALKSALEATPACALVPAGNANCHWFTKAPSMEDLVEAARSGLQLVTPIPLGASIEKLKRLEQEVNKHQTEIIGYAPLRTSPLIQWLTRQLEAGVFGRICMVEWNLFLNTRVAGEDPINTLLYPYLDLQQRLFGPVSGLNATFSGNRKAAGAAQAGLVSYRIDTEGIGLIAYTTQLWHQSMETSLVILGEHASIKIGGSQLDQLEYCQGIDVPAEALATASPEACTIDWMVNNNLNNAFGIQDALKTRDLIERIYALRNEQHVRKTA